MKSPRPLVSVVIPNYNSGRFLGAAVESVLTQTYSPLEVFVVDDGSSDGSLELLRRFRGRVRLLQNRRQGVSAARNRGIRESGGEFVAFLDADDLWRPDKLAQQVLLAADPKIGMVYCGLQYIDSADKPLGTSISGSSGRVLTEISLMRWPGVPAFGSTALVRREVLEKVGLFDPALSTSADWDLWRRISCRYEIALVRQPLALYRLHAGSMHRRVEVFERDMLLAFSKLFADPAAAGVFPLRRRCYANLYLVLSGSYLHEGRWGRCLAYAVRSVALWPGSLSYIAQFPWRWMRRVIRGEVGREALL